MRGRRLRRGAPLCGRRCHVLARLGGAGHRQHLRCPSEGIAGTYTAASCESDDHFSCPVGRKRSECTYRLPQDGGCIDVRVSAWAASTEWGTTELAVTCSAAPTAAPPTGYPTLRQTGFPSRFPSRFPSASPRAPTGFPKRTGFPTRTGFPSRPTGFPSRRPTGFPSRRPTGYPSRTGFPSRRPTGFPSRHPTGFPSRSPTGWPTT
eukprot:TRINITY_DN22240_c0_g2_i2.p3 TRINITY_DN22240_c0_g2~~TRINITY_DN22240_c0_g2_i2.p3  ORF type:complete len:206 (+),score=8.29 TRINITY_DN22240_c0_g2_i2:309-926(+)